MNRKMLSSPSSRRACRTATALVSALLVAAPALSSADSTVKLPQPVPDTTGLTANGRVPSSQVIRGSMSLAPSNAAALQAYADSVSNPRSANYHQFLTPAQVGARFGASTSTVNAALTFLKGKGLTITLSASNHMAILFSGTASKVESAFSTKLYAYTVEDKGRKRGTRPAIANNSLLSLPQALAPSVVAIGGLDTTRTPQHRSTLTPDQARTLYHTSTLYDSSTTKGSGINVGIENYDGYRLANLPYFYSAFALPSPAGGVGANVTKVPINGSNGETADATGEADLDIQMVLGQVPLCKLYIYDDGGEFDPVALLTKMADDNIVDVVSESYGYPVRSSSDAYIIASHNQHAAMTVQGITYCGASGDTGTNLQGYDYPNMDPDITFVGGTVATVSSSGARIAEDGWVGSGSGYSKLGYSFNVRPTYQTGTTVPSSPNYRLFPDLARHASGSNLGFDQYTGNADFAYYIFFGGDGSESLSSGTSASSPLFAGSLAAILEKLILNGDADLSNGGRYRLGRINDLVYSLDGDPTVFFDVKTGDTGLLPDGTEAVGKTGWDYVTGWGAPDTLGLYNAFVNNGSTPVLDAATSASVYTISSPTLTLGTVAGGDVTSLPSTDGVSYTLQSVKQNGVGQVAAATVAVPLQKSKTRRSALVTLSMSLPTKATGYLYLLNASTGVYDLIRTISGTGMMGTSTVALDITANTYISGSSNGIGGTVTALVRSLQPTRLGSAPFKMTIDQLSVTERVARN